VPQTHRALLAALVATTAVITVVMCGVGWLLLDQQGELDEQRARKQTEARADALAADIRGHLADAGDRLSAWLSNPTAATGIAGAVVVSIDAGRVQLSPAGALPFVPIVEPDGVAAEFAEVEAIELREQHLSAAAARYRALMTHRDPRIRAGALYRLGRTLRNLGKPGEALTVADDLVALADVRVGDVPAELAGLLAKRAALLASDDRRQATEVATRIEEGLDRGRWLVTRGDAEAYRDDVSSSPRDESWQLASDLTDAWREADEHLPPRGQRTFTGSGRPAVVLWRTSGERAAMLVAFVDTFVSPTMASDVAWRLVDGDHRVLSGAANQSAASTARTVNAEYPWTVETWTGQDGAPAGGNRAAILAMLVITIGFAWGTAYFMAHAIRREAEVARLQSDFVAAVSHEFRSPLTTVRQLTEMLETDRQPDEGRRLTYYRLLSAEAARLQRLVETLLNFGRMEAGTARYQLADVETAPLVHSVVRDLEPQAKSSGIRIEAAGDESGVLVRADETALAMALRNLIDNAIKYSPGQSAVRVDWVQDSGRVAIRVSDSGLGIPESDHQRVFQKFVRGQAAMNANVKGTGVGLSMVRQIVLGHGGEIRLESRVGQGSTFTMILPSSTHTGVAEGARA
jgi:two-component system phosphate regulon sensor histidine kinase PhoR